MLYPHEENCKCFRCSGIPWNKGKKTGLVPKTAFKKGEKGYWLGKKRPNLKLDHFFKKGENFGEKHPKWNGGRQKSGNGYIYLYKPEHPYAGKRGRIGEHRVIMEQIIGRYLNKKEVVHHINGIRDDNRPENLQLFASNKEHLQFEYPTKDWNNKPKRRKYDAEVIPR